MIYKDKGIIMADYIVENAIRRLGDYEYFGFINAFNNCREQGCIVYIAPPFKNGLNAYITVYVYAHRNTDLPTLTWEYEFGSQIYSEDAWLNRTQSFTTVDYAVDYMVELVENFLKENAN